MRIGWAIMGLCLGWAIGVQSAAIYPILIASNPWSSAPPPQPVRDARLETAEKAVRDVLRDPLSAYFSDLVANEVKGAVYVCGEVNSKNGMGGYTGRKMFIYDPGKNVVALEPEDDKKITGFADDLRIYCRGNEVIRAAAANERAILEKLKKPDPGK